MRSPQHCQAPAQPRSLPRSIWFSLPFFHDPHGTPVCNVRLPDAARAQAHAFAGEAKRLLGAAGHQRQRPLPPSRSCLTPKPFPSSRGAFLPLPPNPVSFSGSHTLPPPPACSQWYVHTRVHTYVLTLPRSQTYVHTDMPLIYTHMLTVTPLYTCSHTHTNKHTCSHTLSRTFTLL